jgi:PAS domain S-box-containing protein
MLEFLRKIFTSDFMAHGYCYFWRPEILWLHVLSDVFITLAYYSIPATLVYFVRKRRDVPFHWIFWMFGAFILSCGTTHAMEVWTVWHGTYRLAGLIKLITAALSTGTAAALIPLMPKALSLPSPAQLEEMNRNLESEIRTRERAQEAIKELNESLERRVQERTAQLEAANRELQNQIDQRERAEARFRLMVEHAPNAMVMVNNTGKIVLMNSESEKLFGYRRDELLGQPIETLVPESSRRGHPALRKAFLAAPSGRQMGVGQELRAQRKDGSQFPVEIALNPIETPDGILILSTIIDITFHRQKLESVGVLANGIAHDFNNLLGSILLDTELAVSELAPASPALEELGRIRAVAIRASEIVRELMIYAGQEKPDRELVDISSLVEEMVELLKVSISKHAFLRINLGRDLPPVLGNAPQIRQVVMNLILNASEALAGTEGAITICTTRVTGGHDLASSGATELVPADYLLLEVSDTGKGMPEEEKIKIFDPFFTTKFAGRGLGLAVVQGIVRSHGGTINLVSALGRGTTFQVLLPCAAGSAKTDPASRVSAPAEGFSGVRGTVLVVEDEPTLRAALAKMLATSGAAVFEARDGFSAIELFRSKKQSIDVVLLDLTIPGAPSREVISEMRRLRPDIKLILMSAYEMAKVFPPPDTPEVAGFIRKPFHLSDLVQLLRDVLTARQEAGA